MPAKTLKTLALIAFHQPILQSELKCMVGERVYDHMHELHERGLVMARDHGQTKLITTSDKFPEYFGIPETEPERIRTFLAEKLGIKVGPKKEKVPPPELAEADAPPADGAPPVESVEPAPATPSAEPEPVPAHPA